MTPVSGQTNVFDMERADEPTVVGTALNKSNLLTDAVAAVIGALTGVTPATPNEALKEISDYISDHQIVFGSYEGTGAYGSSNPNRLNFDARPVFLWVTSSKQYDVNYNSSYNVLPKDNMMILLDADYITLWQSTQGTTTRGRNLVTWGADSIEWYCTNSYSTPAATYSPHIQLNATGQTYYYLAICA